MLDLTKTQMPSTIEVGGICYSIHTDYQYWIRFNKLLENKANLLGDFDFLYKETELEADTQTFRIKRPQDRQKGIDELIKFNFPKKLLPRDAGFSSNGNKLLDFEVDANLIYAAFYEQYHIDLMNPELHLHWHKFLALLDGLHDTELNKVESYRAWKPSNIKHDRLMQMLQKAWSLENVLSDEEQQALAEFDSLLKK